jgi:hypothetical protein
LLCDEIGLINDVIKTRVLERQTQTYRFKLDLDQLQEFSCIIKVNGEIVHHKGVL